MVEARPDAAPAALSASIAGHARPLASLRWQAAATVLATAVVAALHWGNDGLWFQGDAPRHAMNGLFAWDLLWALPASPMNYTLAYYARYPVIAPLAYPPLFYLLEGLMFWAIAPSPYVAKALVLVALAIVAAYTMAWCRRWVHPVAGWAGAMVPLLPSMTMYSHAVLLNVPATACAIAAYYHCRRWIDEGSARQLAVAGAAAIVTVLTYYPGAVLLGAPSLWVIRVSHRAWPRRAKAWLVGTAGLTAVPVVLASVLLPTHTARHMPDPRRLFDPASWLFYLSELPGLIGPVWLIVGGAGLVLLLARRALHTESQYLWSWIVVTIVTFIVFPARSDRYLLILGPAFVVAGAIACRELVRSKVPRIAANAVLVVSVALTAVTAARAHVPRVDGFREVAAFLRESAPRDGVLYDGKYDGVFGFYARALDPRFERRLVLTSNLLFEAALDTRFRWVYKGNVQTAADVIAVIRQRSNCRWVIVEDGRNLPLTHSQRLLRSALSGPEFELVRTFPVESLRTETVKVYRLIGELADAPPLDLSFPSFGGRVYERVLPIATRP